MFRVISLNASLVQNECDAFVCECAWRDASNQNVERQTTRGGHERKRAKLPAVMLRRSLMSVAVPCRARVCVSMRRISSTIVRNIVRFYVICCDWINNFPIHHSVACRSDIACGLFFASLINAIWRVRRVASRRHLSAFWIYVKKKKLNKCSLLFAHFNVAYVDLARTKASTQSKRTSRTVVIRHIRQSSISFFLFITLSYCRILRYALGKYLRFETFGAHSLRTLEMLKYRNSGET